MENRSTGIGFCGLLTIAFIVLKVLKLVDWSWGVVLAPLWLPIVVIAVFIIVAGIWTSR